VNHANIYQSLICMIDWTREFRQNLSTLPKTLSKKAYLKEFCTVGFRLPRQSGHSHMIKKLCEQDIFKNPMIIVPNLEMRLRFEHNYQIKAHTVIDLKYGVDIPSAVIVDCYSLMRPADMDKLYNYFSSAYLDPDFIILLME